MLLVTSADAATVVALGASNTYGKGVQRDQAYPAQLEAVLRSRGYSVNQRFRAACVLAVSR